MKELSFRQVLTIIVISLLCVALIGGIIVCVYYDDLMSTAWDFAGDTLSNWGKHDSARFCYERAIKRNATNADAYSKYAEYAIGENDFTLSERILVSAIESNPDRTDFYLKLAKIYYSQDKLSDIDALIDSAEGSAAYSELTAMRPAAPVSTVESGLYNEHIEVSLSAENASVCVSTGEDFPSVHSASEEVTLKPTNGLNRYKAVAVNEHCLVSESADFEYILEGVSEEVTFADPVFESFIRNTLDKSEDDPIMTMDIWGVKKLEIPVLDAVGSFIDLAMFTELKVLKFESQPVSDWSFLASIANITELSAAGCSVTTADLEYISMLPKLMTLDLEDNQIASIDALSKCTGLKELDLSDNSIHDISPLAGITGLLRLDISANAVTSIDALAQMDKLSVLDCSYLILSDISALEGKEYLAELTFDHCSVEDISALEGCSRLRFLSCDSNQILSLSALAGCSQLRTLKAARNRISDIFALSWLPCLEYADLTSNLITALPDDMSELTVLSTLLLANNNIAYLTSAKDLVNLTEIDIEYNKVGSLEPLESCTKLTTVKAFGNTAALYIGKLEELGITVYR